MAKTTFLFPGQGSQFAGMGKDFAEAFPVSRVVFEQADEALGFPLSRLCFEGPAEELQLTENTQPAILATSVAILAAVREQGLTPDLVAGHSLGEYSALVAAGCLDLGDALRIVRKRGQLMQQAVPAGVGAMAAILGLDPDQVQAVCDEAAQGQVCSPANLNSPGQIVIAGHAEAVARAVDAAKAAGAKRAIPLAVSAPFHCALMKPALDGLTPELDAAEFRDLEAPLVNNFAAALVTTGQEARQGLKDQIPNPVRWQESIARLAAEGSERFIEVGPGRVLAGLLRNIDRSLDGASVGTVEQLEKVSTS